MISKALAKKNLQAGSQVCRACSHLWLDIDTPRRVGDRETMLTEAMKFRGKMNDESIKQTEKYNKDVKKAEADRDEAVRNFEIAKGANKAEADVYKRGYTALQSHVNRLTTKLIDLGIDARVADGAGGKITQGVFSRGNRKQERSLRISPRKFKIGS